MHKRKDTHILMISYIFRKSHKQKKFSYYPLSRTLFYGYFYIKVKVLIQSINMT